MHKLCTWVATLTLAGCSFAPAYQRPELPVPAQWPTYVKVGAGDTAAHESLSASIVQPMSWRSFFTDPRLQRLIEAALDHNRDMRIAIARVEEAQALYGVTHADRLPTINIGATQSAARTPAQLSPTLQTQTNRRYDVNLGMTAFELDFWGRVKNLDAAARANYLATAQAREAFRLSLIADVANAYYSLQALDERHLLAQATLDSRADSRRLIGKRRDVGLAGDLDFLAADAAYESARAELANIERNQHLASNTLDLFVGTVTQDLPPGRRLIDQGELPALLSVPSEVLLRRPDVRSAEQRLLAANANIGAARAAFFPRIGLSLAFGTASRTLSGLFDAGTGAWSFAPSLVQPLFDSGRTQANVSLTEARKVIAVAEYEKTIQQAFREVADALAARDQLSKQLSALNATEKSQTERLKLVDARYRAGVSSYLELLDAQRDTFTAQQSAIQARSAMLTAAAQLYKALGGDAPADEIDSGKNS
ncbi:MAG: efflux transporter outer membrane subunit [Rugosibacter sp.]|jgi:multidrug efflux system outer membrane protein|nr:efflux transporter outer membrane subunit [Rugosibacter sp.]